MIDSAIIVRVILPRASELKKKKKKNGDARLIPFVRSRAPSSTKGKEGGEGGRCRSLWISVGRRPRINQSRRRNEEKGDNVHVYIRTYIHTYIRRALDFDHRAPPCHIKNARSFLVKSRRSSRRLYDARLFNQEEAPLKRQLVRLEMERFPWPIS